MLEITPGRNMKAVITCDHCKGNIDTLYPPTNNSNLCELEFRAHNEARPYKGWNHNDHYHYNCRKKIERGYDQYIAARDMFGQF